MRSSYRDEDVTFLLKDITGFVEPMTTDEREKRIQSGISYCEMLPLEAKPSEKYLQIYNGLLTVFAEKNAAAIANLAQKVVEAKGKDLVIISLARAGTPIGILLKRYLKYRFGISVPHYSISIIRGKGIDQNAMKYLLHRYEREQLLFVDGWTGKGAIRNELGAELAVVADPAGVAEFSGTNEDLLIPCSCLNSIVSGLISRTFFRDDIIGKDDFHGAMYYEEFEPYDMSYSFIEAIEKHFSQIPATINTIHFSDTGIDEAHSIAERYGIKDINLVKPGIGETTRVLLRRQPWKILISDTFRSCIEVAHILRLADEKSVPVEYVPLRHYKACGLIKELNDI